MGLIESLIKMFFLQKAGKELVKAVDNVPNPMPVSTPQKKYRSLSEIRLVYFAWDEVPANMLAELFRREPDLIDEQMGDDCREFLHLHPKRHINNGVMCYEQTCFTFSARNRFFMEGLAGNIMLENLRDCTYLDFSNRPIDPVVDPISCSISLDGYTLFFDHPYFYNLMLLLLKDSETRFRNGERVTSRAVRYPAVEISETVLKNSGVVFDETVALGLKLSGAFYAVLNDFNVEQTGETDRKYGNIEFRVIDGRINKSDETSPFAIADMLVHREAVEGGYMWLSIAPGQLSAFGDHAYMPGVQFNFLDTAEDVIIKGDIEKREIFVCRTREGWGGVKFAVKNIHDYYSLAAWLVVAVSTYYAVIKGRNRADYIRRYWDSYPCD